MPGEELNELQLPHSVMAEQSVLGSMLINEKCIAGVIGGFLYAAEPGFVPGAVRYVQPL